MREKLYVDINGYLISMRRLAKALRNLPASTVKETSKAVEDWAIKVQRKGVENLNRPQWLLSRSIGRKLVAYQDGAKIWSMVGFKIYKKNSTRDPGFYGRYHEGGYKSNARKKFLRRAKIQYKPALMRRIEAIKKAALQEVVDKTNSSKD